jgi:hypothetical protein
MERVHNPSTGMVFHPTDALAARQYLNALGSYDPRFLELDDIKRNGLALKETAHEPLLLKHADKERYVYNAADINGMPPLIPNGTAITRTEKQQEKSKAMDLGF